MSQCTGRTRLAHVLGYALIALAFYAMLSAIIMITSFMLLQRGVTSDLPWVSSVQKYLYRKAIRNVWQGQVNCVDFDGELIYRPRIGTCQFDGFEFKTVLNFSEEGRFTGEKPVGVGIAVIGDSHAMGWGVEDEETFAAELQILSQRPVFNLGVSSYGTVRELLRLEKSGLLDRVDTVVIQYCSNDLKENRYNRIAGIEKNREKFEKITEKKNSFSGRLRMIKKNYGFTFSLPFKYVKEKVMTPFKDFSPHYQALMAVLESHASLNSKRVLIFYMNRYGQRFYDFPVGKDKSLPNVEFIDVSIDLSVDTGDFYRLDDHMTPAGHRKVAASIFGAISQ